MVEHLSERLSRCYTAAVHDVMRGHGLSDFVLPVELRPLLPDTIIAGPAFTFQGHADPTIAPHDTYLAWTGFLADAPAGAIAVCQPNDRTVAHMGELSAETLKLRGIRGYVVDGGCRDTAFIRRLGFPVWCRYATPSDIVGFWLPQDFGEPIVIGNVRICTGDFLLADDDGVVVIPQGRVPDIVAETEGVMGRENLVRRAILNGMNPREAYLTYRKF
jgi:4-hydroxy-4-methyl-2-oxoglutarate aldolase